MGKKGRDKVVELESYQQDPKSKNNFILIGPDMWLNCLFHPETVENVDTDFLIEAGRGGAH